MFKYVILISIIPAFVFGQSTVSDLEAKGYSQAIAEYIKAAHEKDTSRIDTLFIGKHEEFPDIQLPTTIQNTPVILLTTNEAEKKFQYRKSLIFVNMVGTIAKDIGDFTLITFVAEKSPEKVNWWPKHNCYINLITSSNKKEFKLDKLKFECSYSNKYTGKK